MLWCLFEYILVTDNRLPGQYLDLLKKALTFTLYPTVGMPIGTYNYVKSGPRRALGNLLRVLLNRLGLALYRSWRVSDEAVREGRIWPPQAYSMAGMARLDQLQDAVETVLKEGVPGDLIETGVWRGGASILMRATLFAYGVTDRRVFVADSFTGLPAPDAARYPADAGDILYRAAPLAVSLEEVRENFRRFGLLDEQVVFVKGWFKDTLPALDSQQFAIIRLDGDLYESTMQALEALYPKLSPGGFCIIDDGALPACMQAVNDYRARHAITAPIEQIDWTGCYWRKPI